MRLDPNLYTLIFMYSDGGIGSLGLFWHCMQWEGREIRHPRGPLQQRLAPSITGLFLLLRVDPRTFLTTILGFFIVSGLIRSWRFLLLFASFGLFLLGLFLLVVFQLFDLRLLSLLVALLLS